MSHECIDVHTHFVPATFPPYLGHSSEVAWPQMVDAKPCHKTIVISGRNYRTVNDGCWSVARRLEEMPGMGVSQQAVSAMPELMSYWLPLEDGKALIRYINDELAKLVGECPARFLGLGGVPMQDVDAAIAELDYVVHVLGFAGVQIASHVNGKSIGDASFERFFAEAARLGAAVFVHALRPAGTERLVGPFPEQAVLFPADIGFAAASMITGGVAARHPRLRIGFSHGGGALAVTLPRIVQVWKSIIPGLDAPLTESPIVTARRFYYDHLVFDPTLLRMLIDVYGETQIMIGSDYPFFPAKGVDPFGDLERAGIGADIVEAITVSNGRRFLGII